MALIDVADEITQEALRGLYGIRSSIEQSPVAEVGPPTGVKAFQPGEASTGAFLAKLGARIFQRARERAEHREKLQKEQLDQAYRVAQINRLEALANPPAKPTYEVEVNGRKFAVDDAGEAARIEMDKVQETRLGKDDQRIIDKDPYTGKPLPVKMSVSEWLRLRGQDLSRDNAREARDLRKTLAETGGTSDTQAQESTDANRLLSQLEVPDIKTLKLWAQEAAADSLRRAGKRPQGRALQKLADRLLPQVEKAARDSVQQRKAAPLQVLERSALRRRALSAQGEALIQRLTERMNEIPE